MSITIGTEYVALPPAAFVSPNIGPTPFNTLAVQANTLYALHAPPLVSVMPSRIPATADANFTCAIFPSADGMRYFVTVTVWTADVGTIDLSIAVSDSVGASWSILDFTTLATSSSFATWETSFAIAADRRHIRIIGENCLDGVSAPMDWFCSHFMACPYPDTSEPPFAAPFAVPSGFKVWDDALLTATGGPLSTEMVERIHSNSYSVLRDRHMCVASFCQEEGPLALIQSNDDEVLIGVCKIDLPNQGPYALLRMAARMTTSGSGAVPDFPLRAVIGDWSVKFTGTGELETSETSALVGPDKTMLYLFATGTATRATCVDYFIAWLEAPT